MILDSIEPIGLDRHDINAGIIASTMANCHLPKGRSVQPADLMPKWWERPTNPAEKGRNMAEQLKAWALAYNEQIKKNHELSGSR
jgi:hypothetical protein